MVVASLFCLSFVVPTVESVVENEVYPFPVSSNNFALAIYALFRRSFTLWFFTRTFWAFFYNAKIVRSVSGSQSIEAQSVSAVFAIHSFIVLYLSSFVVRG